MARTIWLATALALGVALSGCEKTSDETIDKWSHTEHGKPKLVAAVENASLDPALAAHAAANLVRMGDGAEVQAQLGKMAPARRAAIVGALAPRLWEMARVDGELDLPRLDQAQAKDALVQLRGLADDTTRAQIDAYLTDWYCVASYERRAQSGIVLGEAVMRMIGPAAGKRLIPIAETIVRAPGEGGKFPRVGDQLLLGIAASGAPDGVAYLVELAKRAGGDPTLAKRALAALYAAYIDPDGRFAALPPAQLEPVAPALEGIARDGDAEAAAYAAKLIAAIPDAQAPMTPNHPSRR